MGEAKRRKENRDLFGTVYQPGKIRLGVKVMEEDGNNFHCQGLTNLKHYIIPKDWFYPPNAPESMMMLDAQINEYKELPLDEVMNAYIQSEPEIYI